jgi:hypothetical protein
VGVANVLLPGSECFVDDWIYLQAGYKVSFGYDLR